VLDRFLRPAIDPPLSAAARALARRGVTALAVTLAGLAAGLAAGVAAALGAFGLALALFALSRLADGLDGAVARLAAPRGTALGGHIDILTDFAVYAALPLGFVLHDPAGNGGAGAFLLAAYYVNGASFLGAAILAERAGRLSEVNGAKALHHEPGLLEGTETILFCAAICLVPGAFVPLAWGFGALCLLTAGLRTRSLALAEAQRTGATGSSRSTQ
jgi:phosphatidylglycerophosphate synthase